MVSNGARRTRDEGPAARMGRAPLKANDLECPVEPDHDGERIHRAASFGPNNMPWLSRDLAPSEQGVGKIGMNWIQPTATLLCRVITKLDVLLIWPLALTTMSHVKFAISPARIPAFADNRTITRLRIGFRVQSAKVGRSATSAGECIFACLPSMCKHPTSTNK